MHKMQHWAHLLYSISGMGYFMNADIGSLYMFVVVMTKPHKVTGSPDSFRFTLWVQAECISLYSIKVLKVQCLKFVKVYWPNLDILHMNIFV